MAQIDRNTCKQITADAQAALNAVAEKYGLTVKVSGGTYVDTSFRTKVEFLTADAAEQDWRRVAALVGLHPDDFGRSFTVHGDTYRVVGINLRAQRFPVIAEREDGRRFKFAATAVQRNLHPSTAR